LRDSAKSSIRPKEQKLLTALLSRPDEAATYKELWTAVWPEIENFEAVRRTMTETKSTLDKLLRDILKSDVSIIQTISTVGYRINGPVMQHPKAESLTARPDPTKPDADSALGSSSASPEIQTTAPASATLTLLFSAHPWHVLGSCAIYSSAYVCILLLEVAYSSEQSWHRALVLSPLVFSWIFLTSISALLVDWKLTLKRGANALPLLILSFIAAALVLYGMLSFFLPGVPITEATFQTQTAQGAFLKDIAIYFLPLVIVFLLIPFHLVASLRHQLATNEFSSVRDLLLHKRRANSPRNAIYIRPRTLGFILLTAGIACLPGTYWLLENLKSGPYMNRFTQLVMCRLILYFGLGAECLLWYSRTLNEIKSSLD
jgi:DNA-binding winged helix-turn-helix (wHTH) protein